MGYYWWVKYNFNNSFKLELINNNLLLMIYCENVVDVTKYGTHFEMSRVTPFLFLFLS